MKKMIPLSSDSEKLFDEYRAYEENKNNAIAGWGKRLVASEEEAEAAQKNKTVEKLKYWTHSNAKYYLSNTLSAIFIS